MGWDVLERYAKCFCMVVKVKEGSVRVWKGQKGSEGSGLCHGSMSIMSWFNVAATDSNERLASSLKLCSFS